MTNVRKTKSLHHITVEGCSIATRLEYNPVTEHIGIFTSQPRQRMEYLQQYHTDNKKRLSGNAKQYYITNRETVLHRVKQYSKDNSEKVAAYRKQYYITNHEKVLQHVKQYRKDNPERVAAYKKWYADKNHERIAVYKKCYREDNIEKITEYQKQYRRDHPTDDRAYVTNALSCAHLNEWFGGCRRHHVDPNTIVHIPTEMHTHNRHNIRTGDGMDVINALAFEFLFQGEL